MGKRILWIRIEIDYSKEWRIYAVVIQMCKMESIDHNHMAYVEHIGIRKGIICRRGEHIKSIKAQTQTITRKTSDPRAEQTTSTSTQ